MENLVKFNFKTIKYFKFINNWKLFEYILCTFRYHHKLNKTQLFWGEFSNASISQLMIFLTQFYKSFTW